MADWNNDNAVPLSDSFEALFFRYAKGLVVFANQFVSNRQEAEDIVHDVFVSLWEKMDDIDTQTVQAYLFLATRNLSLNPLSHLRVRTKYQEDILAKTIWPVKENTDYYVQSELRRFLDEAIAKLPPQRRNVFIMSRIEGKPADQIAEELGISRRTVDKHIQLASAEVREYVSMYLYSFIALGLFQ